jgi:hypothetical protein
MTTTDQTTITDRTILGVTFPAALVEKAQQSAAEVRAILSDARPILERAAAVLGQIRANEEEAYTAAKLLTDDLHALDGTGYLLAEVSGSRPLHDALEDLSDMSSPMYVGVPEPEQPAQQ